MLEFHKIISDLVEHSKTPSVYPLSSCRKALATVLWKPIQNALMFQEVCK